VKKPLNSNMIGGIVNKLQGNAPVRRKSPPISPSQFFKLIKPTNYDSQ